MSELPDGVPAAQLSAPRDSASCIILRGAAQSGWRVLIGTRSRRASFMPGHLSFPGGVVDPEDGTGDPGRFLRCATREVLEETGAVIDPQAWLDAGERITPPIFPVRYLTRFFVARLPEESPEPAPATSEIEQLGFVRAADVLADWERGRAKLPPPVLPLLRELVAGEHAELEALSTRIAEANALEQRSPRIEFLPGVWMLPLRTATLPPATHTNVWMPGGAEFVVIDPGSGEESEVQCLLDVVERRRRGGDRPQSVLLTHHHRDHVGGALRIAAQLGLPLRAHPAVLRELGPTGEVRVAELEDGSEIDLGGLVLRAHLTPGHAPGHLAFELVDRGAIVTGDLVSGLSTILIDPDHGNMADYLASLRRVRELGARLLLPGHGPPLPTKALDRLIEHRKMRERRILEQLGPQGVKLERIARAVYDEAPELPLPLIERQTLSHLKHLDAQGVARPEGPDSWVAVSAAGWAGRRGTTSPPSGSSETTPQRIERILGERLQPAHFALRDDSAKHAGHAAASSGGGHYKVVVVSSAFEGRSLLERHRMVNEALSELFGEEIHALALKTMTPGEWQG